MKLNRFQQDVKDFLYDRLVVIEAEGQCFENMSVLVDAAFESDVASNFSLVGNTVHDSTKYVIDNWNDGIQDTLKEAGKQGISVSLENFMDNPNGFLLQMASEESKNLLSRSSLSGLKDFILDAQLKGEMLEMIDDIEKDITRKEAKSLGRKSKQNANVLSVNGVER